MRRNSVCVAAVCFTFILSTAHAEQSVDPGTNLVQDPGFELGPSSFEAQDDGSSVAQVSTNPIDGSGSLRVAIAGYGNNVWWTYDVYGVAASRFSVSAHLRSDIDSSSELMFCAMAYFADGSADLNCTPVPGAAGDKGQVSAAVDLDSTRMLESVRFRLFQEGSEPVTFTLDNAVASLDVASGSESSTPPSSGPPSGSSSSPLSSSSSSPPSGSSCAVGMIKGRLIDQCAPDHDFTGVVVHVPGRALTAILGHDGHFVFDFVRPGKYSLSIEQGGAAVASVPNVMVDTDVVDLGDVNTTDLMNDPDNCGACGQSCGDSACVDGICVSPGGICTPGSASGCYEGPAGTAGVGACTTGVRMCDASGTGYGACVGAITPTAESCGDGIDNDCDGAVDDGCVCVPGLATFCYDGPPGTAEVGVCQPGIRRCDATGTGYGECVGQVAPDAEVCDDGLDNDCDGVVDDGCTP